MAMGAPTVVDRPARAPIPYGLFSVVDFRPAGDPPRWINGIEWQALTCDPASGIGDPECVPDPETGLTQAIGLPKASTSRSDVFDATPFAVYHHLECTPGAGWDPATADAEASEALALWEQQLVEQVLWTGELGNEPNFQQATVLALTQTNPAWVIGSLEKAIRRAYGGLGVIHVGTIGAAVLFENDLLVVSGSRVTTRWGTPVVIGTGYLETQGGPTLGAAPSGQVWAVATSAIFGYRSEIFTPSNTPGDLLDRGTNDLHGVAERQYVLGTECGMFAATFEGVSL